MVATAVRAPKPNKRLLRKTLAYIEAHPEEWQQHTWRCTSGMCFAGTAVTVAGGEWGAQKPTAATYDMLVAETGDDPNHMRFMKGRLLIGVRDRATRLLGLTDRQAEQLFAFNNTLPTLRRMVGRLTSDRPAA